MREILEKIRTMTSLEFPSVMRDGKVFARLSSLEIVAFVTCVENEFGIEIEPIEVDDQNFGDLERVSHFVSCKVAARP